jgi:hypothetical protein
MSLTHTALRTLSLLAATLVLAACGKPQSTSYQAPKEIDPPTQPPIVKPEGGAPAAATVAADPHAHMHASMPPSGSMPAMPPAGMPSSAPAAPDNFSMAGQTLPDEAIARDSLPQWQVPAGWQTGRTSSMRRASFVADGAPGTDIAVTSFPGDVGGMAANVNRWRGQIGLAAVAAPAAEAHASPLEIAGRPGHWVDISGAQQRTLAGVVMKDGNSWFIKMTGPLAEVASQEQALRAFLASWSQW